MRNCTSSAVEFFGAEQIEIVDCDISGSGGMVPPGPGKNHNLKMNHVARVAISGSRFADSMWGHGVAVIFGRDVTDSRLRDHAQRNRRRDDRRKPASYGGGLPRGRQWWRGYRTGDLDGFESGCGGEETTFCAITWWLAKCSFDPTTE